MQVSESDRYRKENIVNWLLLGVILLLALIAIRVSNKQGIPALLLFIVLGMIFSGLGFEFHNYEFADNYATFGLMVIIFYGGFGTKWKMAKPVAKEAIVLSFAGTILTALITGAFIHWVLGFGLVESMLLGSIIGSTDYSSVSNILRSRNLNLKYNTASLLELESGSNDPFAYTMTMVFLAMILGEKVSVPGMIILQAGVGLLVGFAFAVVTKRFLQRFSLAADGLYAVLFGALMLVTYSTATALRGNGYLALYVLGIYLGNLEFKGKRDVVFFFDGFSEIMQIGLFFLLGLLSNLNAFIANLPVAAAIMLFISIVSRPVAVGVLMAPFKMRKEQWGVVSMAGIRGAAAIAFAIMVVNSGVQTNMDIYHVVFGVCVLSSLAQGSLLAPVSKKLDMLDPNDTVLQTFNYYQDKEEIGFLETRIEENSYLVGTKVRDLNMTFDFIVAKIERDGKTIVPRGETILEEGDLIVLGGETHFDRSGQELTEITLSNDHKWVNQPIRTLDIKDGQLIIMVQRSDGGVIVPVGETVLHEGDKAVIIDTDEKLEFPERTDRKPPVFMKKRVKKIKKKEHKDKK